MPSLSPLEILVVAVIALIVFGPQKLPEIARTVGRAMTELRRMAAEVRSEFDLGLNDVDDEPEDESPPRTVRPEAGRPEAPQDPPHAEDPPAAPQEAPKPGPDGSA